MSGTFCFKGISKLLRRSFRLIIKLKFCPSFHFGTPSFFCDMPEIMLTFAPMNSLYEINRRKEYQAGLQHAFEMPLPENFKLDYEEIMADEETSLATKETLLLWRTIIGPFNNTLAYVVNNRLILEALPYIIRDDSDDSDIMLAEEMFDVLQRLNKATAKAFIATVKGRSGCIESLYRALVEHDEKAFVRLLSDTSCDATPLARLCRSCWEDTRMGFAIGNENLPYYLDYLSELPFDQNDHDEQDVQHAVQRLRPDWELIQDLDDPDIDNRLEQYFRDLRVFNEAHFRMSVHYYQDSYEDFKADEKQLLDSLLQRPEVQPMLAFEEREKGAVSKSVEETPFLLSKDYFDWGHCSNMPTEYFYLKNVVRNKGVSVLADFINYLADKGYIEDRIAVKELLAYRLTGRCRPEGNLPTIEWHGKNGKSYELIYLVRFLSDRGDYRKMRRFFTGPEWVKDRDSSYANSADSEFRKQMSEFYPEACKFVV